MVGDASLRSAASESARVRRLFVGSGGIVHYGFERHLGISGGGGGCGALGFGTMRCNVMR